MFVSRRVHAVQSFLRDVKPTTSTHSESENPTEQRYPKRKKEQEEKRDQVILSDEAKKILQMNRGCL